MAQVSIEELIADWRERRTALDRKIANWKSGPGMTPAFSLKTLCLMAVELDRLIARYAVNA